MPTNTCTVWCLLVAWCLLCSTTTAQKTAYTPGGLRSIESELDDTLFEDAEASNAASRLVVEGQRLDTQGPQLDSHDGELLFQSIPNFPEAESRALATFTGILRGPSQHQQDDSTGSSSSNHHSSTGAVPQQYRSAADEFLQALLKTTRASLADSSSSGALHRPAQHSDRHRTGPGQGPGSDNSMPADSSDASDDITDIDIDDDDKDDDDPEALEHTSQSRGTASTEGPTLQTSLSQDTAAAAAAIGTELLAAAAAAADGTRDVPSSQRIADTASAVDGQVLVTQAEIIPSMQHYSQVVLTSLKMRPMLAQDLLLKATASREGAGVNVPAALNAAAWQEGLKQALESAAAVETNTSTSQMHTRMTSIINLGIELAEPPLAYASAVASSVASSITALTGDESVLVGVSLIRLGSHPAPHNTTSSPSGSATAAASNSSSKGVHTQATQKLDVAAAAGAGQNSMLAMLTLYGVGAPTNAVQVVSTMHQACPELFTYGASLTNSTCGRSIVASYTAAVTAAEVAEAEAKSSSITPSPSAAAAATAAAQTQPSRSLLEDSSNAASDSVSHDKLPTKTWTAGKRTTLLTVKVTTGPFMALLSSSSSTGSRNAAEAAATNKASNNGGSKAGGRNTAAEPAPANKLPNNSSSKSGEKSLAVAKSSKVAVASVAATAAVAQAAPASHQHSPEAAAFLHHSHHFLRVRQQPEVNIIVTQAVGVASGQLPSTLADKLQQLAVSPALADLLAMSGLTLAQAGKPQTIDLSSAAAGLGSSSTLAAASALGSEAAAFGSGRSTGASSDGSNSSSSSRRAATARTEAPGEGGVAMPAVIGMAVAVAVSVMAVCVTAVVIVVVKQRAKAERASAAAAGDQLPKSAKRRRSNKGKGVASKYLPTSHPALTRGPQAPDSRPFPPPPCVIVTAVSGPCQHTPGQSPCKPCLPSHLSAPLNSAGSSALISLGSGSGGALTLATAAAAAAAAAAGAVSTSTGAASRVGGLAGAGGVSPLGYHAGLLGPAVTRGDSVSSAVMADFAEQRRQLQAEVGDGDRDDEEDNRMEGQGSEQQLGEAGSDGYDWAEPEQALDTQHQQQQQLWGAIRGPAALTVHSHCQTDPSSSNSSSHFGWRSNPQGDAAAPSRTDAGMASATSSSMELLAQRSALPTLRTLFSVNSGGQDQPGSCPHSSKSHKASPFMTYDVSVLLGAASAATVTPAGYAAAQQSHQAATAAPAAGQSDPAAVPSSVTDSGMLFPQWTSSPRFSAGSFGAPGSPASPSCVTTPLAACSGSPTAAYSSKEGMQGHEHGSPSAHHAKQGYHTQQQQQQGPGQRSLRAAAAHGAARSPVRSSPFMRPSNVPPGLE